MGGSPGLDSDVFRARFDRTRAAMADRGIDALLLSAGADLPWLTGYEARATERPTVLVVPVDDGATLVIPRLEAPRVDDKAGAFTVLPWGETERPVDVVAHLVGGRRRLAFADRAWAILLLALQRELRLAVFEPASVVMSRLRRRKDPSEVVALMQAGRSAHVVTTAILGGEVRLIGRREIDVSRDVADRLWAAGNTKVESPLVASGPNSASPHHSSGERVIRPDEPVIFDFCGAVPSAAKNSYWSDTSRTVFTGRAPAEFRAVYEAVRLAQEAGIEAARVGVACEALDRATRKVIADAGYESGILHRTGHGIGLEVHEEPFIVEGNSDALASGDAFTVEPGIYLVGEYGVRIEDVIVLTDDGPSRCNSADRRLCEVVC